MPRFALAAALLLVASAALAAGETHRVAVHVDENDPQVMNMALNNVANVAEYYAEQGDEVVVEIVAYGPGLQMLIEGDSPVADRIETMSMELSDLKFSACQNTLDGMEEKVGHEITLMQEASMVPSGVVRLIELQEDGYAYVRP